VELRNLVRGLTAAELELHWCGGSVAGVIWVYRRFESRFPDKADESANWVQARSGTPYAPFGRMRAGARSASEFRSYGCVSSAVGLKIDFDMALLVMASGLYRLLARRMRAPPGREGTQADSTEKPAGNPIPSWALKSDNAGPTPPWP